MTDESDAAPGEPGRLDRELGEFPQELRVILPGVQVLFAFLLTVPFSQRCGAIAMTSVVFLIGDCSTGRAQGS